MTNNHNSVTLQQPTHFRIRKCMEAYQHHRLHKAAYHTIDQLAANQITINMLDGTAEAQTSPDCETYLTNL
jgi:hypothetical protein